MKILIEGPAGEGKSTLARDLITHFDNHGTASKKPVRVQLTDGEDIVELNPQLPRIDVFIEVKQAQ